MLACVYGVILHRPDCFSHLLFVLLLYKIKDLGGVKSAWFHFNREIPM